jgi:hypothetical protein
MPRTSVTTGNRVGSGQHNPVDEHQRGNTVYFDPVTLVSAPFEVHDSPVSVRAFGLTDAMAVQVQMVAGANEGDVFDDLIINGHSIHLSASNRLLVIPIDGRYRLRLIGATPDDVRVLQFRTNAWMDMEAIFMSNGSSWTLATYAQLVAEFPPELPVGISTLAPMLRQDLPSQIAVGFQAGVNATGNAQTALGVNAGYNNSGVSQVAVGSNAGLNNTKEEQVAVGNAAGVNNTGIGQTAIGYQAGQQNSGYSQVAVGTNAGYNNTADEVTQVGHQAGHTNTGQGQTAFGTNAGYHNTGTTQTAVGVNAGLENTAAEQTALGNAAGVQNTGVGQVAIGYQAGQLNEGYSQVAVGANAGYSNEGNQATEIGYAAGHTNTGADLVAIGFWAGNHNSGDYATLLGAWAGEQNTGMGVVGLGIDAARYNSKEGLTAVGAGAGYNNLGLRVTAVGFASGHGSVGDHLTAVGSNSGIGCRGLDNTYVGWDANVTAAIDAAPVAATITVPNILTVPGHGTPIGEVRAVRLAATTYPAPLTAPTLIVVVAIDANTYHLSETLIQFSTVGAGVTLARVGSLNNAAAFGAGAKAEVSNQIILGNTSVTQVKTYGALNAAGTAYPSDGRMKHVDHVLDGGETLAKLLTLDVVSFEWNKDACIYYDDPTTAERVYHVAPTQFDKKHTGVLSQQVKDVFPEFVTEDDHGMERVDYAKLAMTTIAAMRGLATEMAELKAKLNI